MSGMKCPWPLAVKLSVLLGLEFNICMLCERNGENFQTIIKFNVQEQKNSKDGQLLRLHNLGSSGVFW